jgi:hypothetical protein
MFIKTSSIPARDAKQIRMLNKNKSKRRCAIKKTNARRSTHKSLSSERSLKSSHHIAPTSNFIILTFLSHHRPCSISNLLASRPCLSHAVVISGGIVFVFEPVDVAFVAAATGAAVRQTPSQGCKSPVILLSNGGGC